MFPFDPLHLLRQALQGHAASGAHQSLLLPINDDRPFRLLSCLQLRIQLLLLLAWTIKSKISKSRTLLTTQLCRIHSLTQNLDC